MDEVSDALKEQLARSDRRKALSKIAFWLDYPKRYAVDPKTYIAIYNWMVCELTEALAYEIYTGSDNRLTSLLFYLIELDPERNFERVMTTLRLLGFAESDGFENNGYPRGKS